ncbi:SIR2 family protein [Pseudomonas knackmussii]|uniref:SIR2 family protein n=1 Tax=Pseudomonas knackmussii TaxID=65741 RepID=UPI003F4A6B69
MSLRFSSEGPAFPEQLVDALLSGEVVFLCGAGVSAPQLPDFRELVEACFTQLNMEMNASEQQSFSDWRFEEVLGSLSRRTVDPADLSRTVVEQLQTPAAPDLANHRTILRLSRDLSNRPVIITTNFDIMLERALVETGHTEQIRGLSFAGQDLPSPGSAGFGGIIHLHGRIPDPQSELEGTPLIITSADYGDAYMRSGWASRFLFDLCRCRTIVLVGYSAGDAPVRYFLNVLEADRQRFPDLRPVYAFNAVNALDEPDVRWSALAVEPLAYEKTPDSPTGEGIHSALWRDLSLLADLVERPRTTRRAWAQEILVRSLHETSQADRERILWLLRGSRAVWPVAIRSIIDASWFDFLVERNAWSHKDLALNLAAWVSLDFQSAERFRAAISWSDRLGKAFCHAISSQLRGSTGIPDIWLRAWRLLALSQSRQDWNLEDNAYDVADRLRGPLVLSADLHIAVELLTPQFKLFSRAELATNPPHRIVDLVRSVWPLPNHGYGQDLVNALVEVQQPGAIMEIATAKLQEVIRLMIDLEAIDDDFDIGDYAVPSVEPHEQNEFHDGPVLLVQLLARLLPELALLDREASRSLAETWRRLPGVLGVRLWMHALRNPDLFTPDEAIARIEALPLQVFWHVRRELALVLRERTVGANQILVTRVEQRILTEAGAYYQRYTIEEGQVDWRSHACDAEVWLRLKMLAAAGRLSEAGAVELAAVERRREYLDREVEERDYFRSWSSGVRTVVGDAQPILEAEANERLAIALEVIQSPDIDTRLGWSVYCRTDPQGAFDTLSQADLDTSNAPLWEDLINSLSFPQGEREAALNQLVVSIFETLQPAPERFLALITNSLTNLYRSAPRRTAPEIVAWWPKLFRLAVAHVDQPLDVNRELFQEAINSPGGRLTEALLSDIDQRRNAGEPMGASLLDTLSRAAAAEGCQGTYARAILVRDAAFVLSIDGQTVADVLDAALTGDAIEAVALRAVLVHWTSLSSIVSSTFSRHILRGVTEFDGHSRNWVLAAAKIIAPALALVRSENNAEAWGITLQESARALRNGPPALRKGAANVLNQWISEFGNNPAEAWRSGVSPLLSNIWPRDRDLCEKELTPHFAELAISSEDAFPEALAQLLPYLKRMEGHSRLYSISQSAAPTLFPLETLTLLWQLFGPGCTASLYGVPRILERLIASRPSIELDRRFQWLDQQADHYE